MIKRWATEAIRPIIAIIIHSFKVGLIQTEGINTLIINSPTTPVNNSVSSELSEGQLENKNALEFLLNVNDEKKDLVHSVDGRKILNYMSKY